MKLKVNHIPIFPSVLTQVIFDDFNLIKSDLIKWIYEYQKTSPGVKASNFGGWQSESNFYKDKSFKLFYNNLMESIKSSLPYKKRFTLQNMWININRTGHRNEFHNHPGAMLSGVFWVQSNPDSGNIVLQSPFLYTQESLFFYKHETLNHLHYNSYFSIVPKEGTAIIFPSELYHYVQPNQSPQDRISISFNLTIHGDFYGEPT